MFRTSSVHHQERFVQAVFADLVRGTTVRTTRHVQPLQRLDVSSTSTVNAYEDGTACKFRNVGTKISDAGRLPKRHNTAT